MKKFLVAAAAAILVACTGTTNSTQPAAEAKPGQSESDRLMTWFEEQFQQDLERYPEYKTYLGMLDDLDAYGRWNDPSEAAELADIVLTQARLDTLRDNFAADKLTKDARVSYEFAKFIAANDLALSEFRDKGYIFTQFFGPHTDMVSLLIGFHRIDTVDHAEAYIRRLESFGDVLNVETDKAEARAAKGVMPPAFAYPVVIETSRGTVTGVPFNKSATASPLWADFTGKLDKLNLPAEQSEALKARARNALLTSVQPAYDRLIAVMQAHAKITSADDGVWKLEDGAAYYQAQLVNYTTREDMSAEQIHQLGLEEVARIHGEMREIMGKVGFKGDLNAFFKHLRDSPQFYYPNTEAGRERYLSEATAFIDQMMARAPDYFGTLPKAALEVRAVEPYRIETATGAFYEPGALDGSRPGAYYVNMSNMQELPVYQMETLAYHEGAPGHHFQSSIAQELTHVPMFQKLTWYSAYGEGWALYAEKMGKDMGFFTDPYQDFGRLSYEVFRAARLVVDTGIHHKRWTEQQARDYMLANTPMTEGDIRDEIRRYIVWPGQAVSYKVGMLTILELRDKAQKALGDEFDYREFHDVVLKNGSVPLSLLGKLVDDWIASKRG